MVFCGYCQGLYAVVLWSIFYNILLAYIWRFLTVCLMYELHSFLFDGNKWYICISCLKPTFVFFFCSITLVCTSNCVRKKYVLCLNVIKKKNKEITQNDVNRFYCFRTSVISTSLLLYKCLIICILTIV